MSWALHRIDDRLIHGQVLVAWGARYHPARIWIADDGVAANEWERALYRDAAPGIEVRVVSVAEAAAAYPVESAAAGAAFLLVRDLAAARRLVESGAAIPAFNVGGLHYTAGRVQLGKAIFLSREDSEALREISRRGVTLEGRPLPSDESQDLLEMLGTAKVAP